MRNAPKYLQIAPALFCKGNPKQERSQDRRLVLLLPFGYSYGKEVAHPAIVEAHGSNILGRLDVEPIPRNITIRAPVAATITLLSD